MTWLTATLRSSIGKKYIVGAMGLLLCLYLVVHLFGNLMLYGGQQWFNTYAETLESMPGLIGIELALAAVFLLHIILAIVVTLGNIKASGRVAGRYAVRATKGEKDLSNTTMIWSGSVVILFLILHVTNLRFGGALFGGTHDYGLYGVLVYLFKMPLYSIFYIICMIVLGFHLWHGVQSVSRTFGFQHPKYFPAIFQLGKVFALVMAIGFSTIPLYVMFVLPSWQEMTTNPKSPYALKLSEETGFERPMVEEQKGEQENEPAPILRQ